MPSIKYETIFNNFLGNITDYDIQVNLSVSDSYELMTEALHKSVSDPYVNRLFSSIALDDDVMLMSYELVRAKDENTDKEFIITALGKWMVYEWMHKRVRSVDMTAQVFAGKEQKLRVV